jgi:hypothetical protein
MVRAELALTFDPNAFDVSAADVQLGSVPEAGSGWHLQAQVNEATGQIGVWICSNTAIESNLGGSLVTIAMHVRDNAPAGATGLSIVPWVNPTDGVRSYQTSVGDAQSSFLLHRVVTASGAEPGAPGFVMIASSLPLGGGSFSSATVPATGPSVLEVASANPAASNALAMAVVEHLFLGLEQTAHLVEDSVRPQPRAIFISEATNQGAENRIQDLPLLEVPCLWGEVAEWLPDDYLAFLRRTAKQYEEADVAVPLDEDQSIAEADNLAGLETLFAGATRKESR